MIGLKSKNDIDTDCYDNWIEIEWNLSDYNGKTERWTSRPPHSL